MTFTLGMVVGLLIGFMLGVLFYWKHHVDASEAIRIGTERWEGGDRAYREAIQVREASSIETVDRIASHTAKIKAILLRLAAATKANQPELSEFLTNQVKGM